MSKKIKEPFLNIGTGKDHMIKWYAKFIMKKLNVNLKIVYDKSKPDGMPKKCLNIDRAKNEIVTNIMRAIPNACHVDFSLKTPKSTWSRNPMCPTG